MASGDTVLYRKEPGYILGGYLCTTGKIGDAAQYSMMKTLDLIKHLAAATNIDVLDLLTCIDKSGA